MHEFLALPFLRAIRDYGNRAAIAMGILGCEAGEINSRVHTDLFQNYRDYRSMRDAICTEL